MELKLLITLRLLAGASYLDMIWYGVSVDTVHRLFIKTLKDIDKVEQDIKPPISEECCQKLKNGWEEKSIRKKGIDIMPGTILAGDGLVIEISGPTEKDRRGLDLAKYKALT